MNQVFNRFVNGVIGQTDSNEEERKDLSEELLSHLQCSYEDLQLEGYSKEEAMKMSMENFGDEKEIGRQLQQAMYPYRREMMLILASASLLFAYSVYLLQLFTRGDAHIIWLVLAVLVGASLLIVTLHPIQSLHRRLWMNGLLISHIFVFIFGTLLATDLDRPYSSGMTFFSLFVVLLAVILVYRTTIYDFPSARQSLRKDAKWIHFINITTGIILILITLFFLWALLIFAEELPATVLLLGVPIVLWMVSYAVQLRLLAGQRKVLTYSIAYLQLFLILVTIAIWAFWV
ncbi:permease prefix domain 1-containing protein [Sporosarcina obsidiansis]|uniref:permease prefix domain 1-containing protein n=1 Tax=Sporosarcina obsidiansis TaxID=2660748 RepID=UPI00129A1B57|nr:permease prefix domain 1-containing protein [Sporosarcina obsidiansis]